MGNRPASKQRTRIWTVDHGEASTRSDTLATEEPMEIRVIAGGKRISLAVTMRTPSNDFELAAGFLFSEGVIGHRDDISGISYCVGPEVDAEQQYNIVNVTLRTANLPDLDRLERHFITSSSCGVCGKAHLDALAIRDCPPPPSDLGVPANVIVRLPDRLREAQGIFDQTGGLHAAALFTHDGQLIALREDVGRHNALDKLIGWSLLEGRLPLHQSILLVSGRTSFELLQKSVAAGIPIVAAVSAPSSLAVDTARRFGITLVGFLRGERFNIYSRNDRIIAGAAAIRDRA